jgi:hypothetical protein
MIGKSHSYLNSTSDMLKETASLKSSKMPLQKQSGSIYPPSSSATHESHNTSVNGSIIQRKIGENSKVSEGSSSKSDKTPLQGQGGADSATPIKKAKLEINNLPAEFSSPSEIENTNKIIAGISEDANVNALALYNSMRDMKGLTINTFDLILEQCEDSFNSGISEFSDRSGNLSSVKLILSTIQENDAGGVIDSLHEMAHLLDFLARPDPLLEKWFTPSDASPLNTYLAKTPESETMIPDVPIFLAYYMGETMEKEFIEYNKEHWNITNTINKKYKSRIVSASAADAAKLIAQRDLELQIAIGNIKGGGFDNLQDIYNALSGGALFDNDDNSVLQNADEYVAFGHDSEYYSDSDSIAEEIFANYLSLSVTRPDLAEMLRKDKPELVKSLDATVVAMLKKWENNYADKNVFEHMQSELNEIENMIQTKKRRLLI